LLADDVAQLQKALANLQSTPPSSGPGTIRKGENARESSSTDQKESSTEERMASVEARIRRAEQTIGSGGRRALGEAVDELRMRVQLIQPSTIEALESRLNALVTRQQGQGQNKATPDKALMEMHDLCRRWDATCQSLPALVTRLQGLRVLHEQAGEATALLAQAEGARMAMTKAVEGDRLAMHDLRLHLAQQTSAIEQRLLAMEKRLSTLGK